MAVYYQSVAAGKYIRSIKRVRMTGSIQKDWVLSVFMSAKGEAFVAECQELDYIKEKEAFLCRR